MEREKHSSSQYLLQLIPVQPEQGLLTGVWTTYRSSLRPKTLMSRQHSFISLVVAAWDSRSLLSKMIWIRQNRDQVRKIWDIWQLSTPVAQRVHLAGFGQEIHRVFSFQKSCDRKTVEECQITICVSLRLEHRSSYWSSVYLVRHISFVVFEQLLCIDLKISSRIHTFGFLTGISSLTVLACTSTSLKACLGSKNLLSILSGARKPGKEINNAFKKKKKKACTWKIISITDVHVTATNPDRRQRSRQTHF